MTKEKFKRCPTFECTGKIMTDELRRGYNAKSDDGKQLCPECKVREIYAKFGGNNA